MSNAKDITSATSNILLIGDSGTHKTYFLGGAPHPYIFDFDGGVSILRGKDVEYDTFKDASPNTKTIPKAMQDRGLYPYGKAWDAFIKKLQEVGARIDKGEKIETVCFDSLTFMSMIAVNKILDDTGHEMPHQGTWGAHHEYFKRVFNEVTAWPVRIIATAHIHRDENDLTKVTEKLPLLAGKLAGLIGAFFDEVYYCDSSVDSAGKQSFSLTTKSTPQMRQAKTRYDVPNGTAVDFKAVAPFYLKTPSDVRNAEAKK